MLMIIFSFKAKTDECDARHVGAGPGWEYKPGEVETRNEKKSENLKSEFLR